VILVYIYNVYCAIIDYTYIHLISHHYSFTYSIQLSICYPITNSLIVFKIGTSSLGDLVKLSIILILKFFCCNSTFITDKITLHIRKAGFWTNKIYEKVHQLERTAQLGGRQNDSYTTHTAIELGNEQVLLVIC